MYVLTDSRRSSNSWNKGKGFKISAEEISYLRDGCDVNRMGGESNNTVVNQSSKWEGMKYRVKEVAKSITQKGFVT